MALTSLPVVTSPGGHPTEAQPVILVDTTGAYVSPGGSGGGGDASAANQLAGNATLASIDGKLAAALPLPVGAATAAAQATTNAALGAPADAEATGDGSIVGLLKRLRTLLAALPLPTGASTSANQTTGNASLASIDSRLGAALPLPAGAATAANQTTGNGFLSSIAGYLAGLLGVVPQMTGGGHLALTTSATSGTYVGFASQACKQATLFNNTGVVLEVQQGGSGVAVPVFPGVPFTFFGITNMSSLGVRRVDLSTTQVTVQARWEF